MPILELTDSQVLDLLKQLPADRQRAALLALASATGTADERMQYAEEQLRRASAQRGLEWDKLSEHEREAFIDDLLHEDRPCGK
jgi:hypothetical protein